MGLLMELNEQANNVCNELIAAKRAREAAKTKADAAYHAGREEELQKWLSSLETMITAIIDRNANISCIARGKKATFHRWSDRSEITEPDIASGGVMRWTVAIVEYEDGQVGEVLPRDIQFIHDEREDEHK